MLQKREKTFLLQLIIMVLVVNTNGCTINIETTTILSTTSDATICSTHSITTSTIPQSSTVTTPFMINDVFCGFVD